MQYLALSKFIFTLKLPIFIEPRSFQNQNRTSQFFKNPQTGFSCGFADTFCYFSFIPTLWLKLYICSILFFRHKIWYIFSLHSTHSISFSDFLQTKCRPASRRSQFRTQVFSLTIVQCRANNLYMELQFFHRNRASEIGLNCEYSMFFYTGTDKLKQIIFCGK